MTVLVTGANGFVGSALCVRLSVEGISVRGAMRALNLKPNCTEAVVIGNLAEKTDWTATLKNVEQVVHLAARVHVINEKTLDPLAEFRQINVECTAALARQAAASGVRRFIFLSSVKVNGEFTKAGQPFTADDEPSPESPYGVSKFEAELILRKIAAETGMEVVIIRSPLVYGPGVKANFEFMMRWLASGIPLPLASVIKNRRSLVAVDNLVDLILMCLKHPKAANQTFLVSDDEDLSTVQLLNRIAVVMGRQPHLFYLPISLLKIGATILSKPDIYNSLCCSLQLDIKKTKHLLNWSPPVSVDEGLRRAVKEFCL